MQTERKNDRLHAVYYLQQIIKLSYSDANEAYEALVKHDDNDKYNISLGYLSMSQRSHLEAMRIYWENELDHHEIESYFSSYEDYAFQLKQVITDKDQNTSWLYSSHEKLIDAWKSTDEFLSDWIKENIKIK